MATSPTDFSGTNPVGTPTSMDVYNASNQAISFREQLPDLEAKLRDALSTKFNESPLFKQRETAQQQFLAAPSQINADISQMQQSGVPLSPTQQQQITGARRAAAFAPLSTANLLLGTQFGGLENMIGGGVKAFEAASQGMTDRANLLNKLREQEVDRMFKERELAIKEKESASGGLDLGKLLQIANFMKPTAGQESQGFNAKSGSTSINILKDLIGKPGGRFDLFASKYGLTRAFNKNAQTIYNESKNAIDVLTRMRTGAALNAEEQKFYDSFIGQWQQDPTVILDQLDTVNKIFTDVAKRGEPFDLGSFLGASGVNVPGLNSGSSNDGFIPD